ncbi:MAG: NAD(P)H-dependent oxidoreductase [Pirellulales bacterium]|nr:NAD(P)H-dependent oxidoreductase [Pirellulales bacterium]
MNDLTRRRFFGAATVAGVVGAVSTGTSAELAAHPSKIKILGIGCSPRPESSTAAAVLSCLEAARAVDPSRIEVELIPLAGKQINGALAADVPLGPDERDDFPQLVPKLTDPSVAGMIIGSPVYFGNMSSLCKAFLERLMVFRKEGFKLSNKVAGVLAVGGARNGGQELTIRSIQTALFCQEMIVVGESRPTAHFGPAFWNSSEIEKITDDQAGMAAAANLGRRVAQVALLIASSAHELH